MSSSVACHFGVCWPRQMRRICTAHPRCTRAQLCSADMLLCLTNAIVIVIGSYAFLNCIRKRAKTVAKMGGAMLHRKKDKADAAKVHPL